MSKWPMVKLGEVIESGGLDGPRKDLRVFSVTKYDGFVPSEEYFSKQVFSKDTSRYRACAQGDFAYATIHLDEGSIGVAPEDCLISPMYTLFRPNYDLCDPGFLLGVLKSKRAIAQYGLMGSGSVERRKAIKLKDLKELQVPLPPLEEQKRIAGILEAAARQLEKVQTALDSLQQMRSSLIEEYCATSEVTVNLDSLASVTGGLSLSGKRAVNPIECEYLRVANIQRNRFLIDDVKTIRCTEKELDRCLVDDGDILMLEANANPYEVGRAAIAETFGRQFVFQNHLFRIRPVGISSIVLNALLESTFVRAQLLRVVKTTSGLNTMTINQARNLRVPQRDPAKNHRFNTQLELLSSQARNLEEKQNLLQKLNQSLAARAFAGAL